MIGYANISSLIETVLNSNFSPEHHKRRMLVAKENPTRLAVKIQIVNKIAIMTTDIVIAIQHSKHSSISDKV